MAEINIEEKRSSIWMWIIAILIIAAIIYFVIYYMDTNSTTDDGVFYLKESYNYAVTQVGNLKGELYG